MIQNNKKNKIIGLTGGIATGKSTVSKILRNNGFVVLDADIIARRVVEIGKKAYLDILKAFGEDVLNDDLTINRKKLGNIIFNSEEHRLMLNSIVHPRVTEEIKREIKYNLGKEKVIFLDIPLLLEEKDKLLKGGLKFDEIWLVYADRKSQLERLMLRDNISEEMAIGRINSQMDIEEKKNLSDKIIDNRGDLSDLKELMSKIIKEII